MSIELLDKAKEKLGTDSEVARQIGKTRGFIHLLRKGTPMPDWVAVKLAAIVSDDPIAALLANKLATAKDDEERAVWFQYASRIEQATGAVLEISGPKPSTETKKPAAERAIRTNKVGRRDWTRTNDPYHVKVVPETCPTCGR